MSKKCFIKKQQPVSTLTSRSLSLSGIVGVSKDLQRGFDILIKSTCTESSIQCHHKLILKQLSQIHELISSDDDDIAIGRRCDALLDAGVFKIILKLFDCTKHGPIIDSCLRLTRFLTNHARNSHSVTNDHVSMCCY